MEKKGGEGEEEQKSRGHRERDRERLMRPSGLMASHLLAFHQG